MYASGSLSESLNESATISSSSICRRAGVRESKSHDSPAARDSSAERVGNCSNRSSSASLFVISARHIWKKKRYCKRWPTNLFTFAWSFFFEGVGPVCPKFNVCNRSELSAKATLPRSKGGALPGFPLNPRSLNIIGAPPKVTSGLEGKSMGMSRLLT